MTGYEIIKKNVNFDHPERIGLRFDRIAGPEKTDVFRIFVLPPESKRAAGTYSVKKKVRPVSGEYDEWGNYWFSEDASGSDMGQPTNIPIKSLDEIDHYQMPDPKAEGRFDGLEEALAEAEEKKLYVQLNSPHCMFERMHFLYGYTNTLMDCAADPEGMSAFAEMLADYQIGIIEEAYRLGKGKIHCYDTTDDWGTQNSLMISPAMFREIFKPQYERIFNKAHKCGMDVRFHTDGKVNLLIPDFIEMGANIINIHQPRLLGIDEVSEIAQGKVCFEVAVDVQKTLPSGNKTLIEEEVKELIDKWATRDGGMIGVEYGYLKAISTSRESMLFALECFEKYGKL